jgi:ABC-type glycerol-3-phosphate transport system substrate-binding protein
MNGKKFLALGLLLLLTGCSIPTSTTEQTNASDLSEIISDGKMPAQDISSQAPVLDEKDETAKNSPETDSKSEKNDEPSQTSDKVIHIYVYDEAHSEFIEENCSLPEGYTYKFTQTTKVTYKDKLDRVLKSNTKKSQDDRIDLFLADINYMRAYVESDYALTTDELGIKDEEFSQMYPYTLEYGKDTDGGIKALTWSVSPDVFIYRRSIAKKRLSSDDPEIIAKKIGTWDDMILSGNFLDILHSDGKYKMVCSGAEFIRPIVQNASSPLVTNNKVTYPNEWLYWRHLNLWLMNYDYFGYYLPNTDEWLAQMTIDGTVLGYVGSDDLIGGAILEQATIEEDNTFGDWAVCPATQPSVAGGTFIFAANGTDNPEIAADILRTLCLAEDTLRGTQCIPNNMAIVAEYAASSDYNSDLLGGQNPYPIYDKVAKIIPTQYLNPYGDVSEQFAGLEVMSRYREYSFYSEMKTYIEKKHPHLTAPKSVDNPGFDLNPGSHYSYESDKYED